MSSAEYDWVRKLVDDHAWVFHIPTQTIGKVRRFYGPNGEAYVSTVNQEPVNAPVLELEEGHTFLATEASLFLKLADNEVAFYQTMRDTIANLVREAAVFAGSAGVAKQTMRLFIIAALTEQAANLRK